MSVVDSEVLLFVLLVVLLAVAVGIKRSPHFKRNGDGEMNDALRVEQIVNPLDMGVSAAPGLDSLETVVDMGFDIEPATAALNACGGDALRRV